MLLRPTAQDARAVVRTTGQAANGLGIGALALGVAGGLAGNLADASALATGGAIGIAIGAATRMVAPVPLTLSWTRGVVSAVATWIVCSLQAAVPLYLSGHYASFLDAGFDAMSGLTTTGLTLVQDLDHLSGLMHLYRHGLQLLGGIAIVVVGLTLLTAVTATASSLRPSDARDERILPSPGRTWRQVGQISTGIVGGGTLVVVVVLLVTGLRIDRALLHGVALAVSAATTGGFAPTSASVGFYHSPLLEVVLVPLMIAGAVSFAIHVAAWRGDGLRLRREFELRTLLVTMTGVLAVVLLGLGRAGTYTDVLPLLRRGVFTAVSAHTTTGLYVDEPRLVATDWGLLAPAALVAAMAVGGMTGSTAGGLKVLRVGVLFRGIAGDIRRVLLPESAVVNPTYFHQRRRPLTDAHVRSAATLLLVFLAAILTGAVALLFVGGTDLTEVLFVSTSAASNGGLSVGTLTAASPPSAKLGLASLMLLGRLEWLTVFAALGFVYAGLRGRP